MKIYLAGSIAAGRDFEEVLKLVARVLEEIGHVVMTKKNVIGNELKSNPPRTLNDRRRIMKRDKKWIRECDAFIAEVSTYSHGVGYEHAYAESLEKPILLLRHKSLMQNKYSAFLDGSDYKKFMFAFYDENNINKIINKFLSNFFK